MYTNKCLHLFLYYSFDNWLPSDAEPEARKRERKSVELHKKWTLGEAVEDFRRKHNVSYFYSDFCYMNQLQWGRQQKGLLQGLLIILDTYNIYNMYNLYNIYIYIYIYIYIIYIVHIKHNIYIYIYIYVFFLICIIVDITLYIYIYIYVM